MTARRLQEGWAALRASDAPARRVFESADPASAETVEGLARVHCLEFDFLKAIGLWEQDYVAFLLREFGAGPDVRPTRMKPRVDATFQEMIHRLKLPKEAS